MPQIGGSLGGLQSYHYGLAPPRGQAMAWAWNAMHGSRHSYCPCFRFSGVIEWQYYLQNWPPPMADTSCATPNRAMQG